MQLPTHQFSRLVTVLAFDLSDPSLDSMILAWDHITKRFLNPIRHHREAAGRLESIRLLSIHDAVHSVFGSGSGYVFKQAAPDQSLGAALAATAQASHDVLSAVFRRPDQQADLKNTLDESLALIPDVRKKEIGIQAGASSAASYLDAFAPFIARIIEVVGQESHAGIPDLRFVGEPLNAGGMPVSEGRWRRSA